MTQTITIKDPAAPATPAQISYLTSLVAKHDCPTVAERFAFAQAAGFLKKGTASAMIDEAVKAPKKDVAGPYTAAAVPAVPTTIPASTLTECPAFGYYDIEGTLYYWDVTGKDFYPQLRKLAVVTNYNGTKKGSWKKAYAGYGAPKVSATFIPYNGKGYNNTEVTKLITVPKVLTEAVLAGAKPMTSAEAGKIGKKMTFCVRCGATLTDPHSVANGIGPVCITYWS